MKNIVYIICIFLSSLGGFAQSQKDSSNFTPIYKHGVFYTIKTTIGTTHTGYVVEETKEYIVLENRNTHEKIEINKSQIVVTNSKKLNNKFHEDIFGENEHASNYMLSGSAFLFKEGSSTANSHWLLLQDMDYAITENWALSVSSFLFYPISVGTKCSFRINDLNYFGFSVNAMGNILSSGGSTPSFWGYTAFGKYTHGNSNKNLSLSFGLISLNSDLFSLSVSPPSKFINLPFVSAAYCNRFSEKFAFNAELWVFPVSELALVGAGFKYLHSDRIAWTFGCFTNIVSVNNTLKLDLKTMPIPYLGLSRKFN